MPRPRRKSRERRGFMSPGAWAYLTDGTPPEDERQKRDWVALAYFGSIHVTPQVLIRVGSLWWENRDRILAEWIRERPGSRPRCWWRFDAPEKLRPKTPPWTTPDEQATLLADLGELTPAERTALGL